MLSDTLEPLGEGGVEFLSVGGEFVFALADQLLGRESPAVASCFPEVHFDRDLVGYETFVIEEAVVNQRLVIGRV